MIQGMERGLLVLRGVGRLATRCRQHELDLDSIEQLQTGIRRYIHYYNHDRIKIKLKGLSPVQYRIQPRPD